MSSGPGNVQTTAVGAPPALQAGGGFGGRRGFPGGIPQQLELGPVQQPIGGQPPGFGGRGPVGGGFGAAPGDIQQPFRGLPPGFGGLLGGVAQGVPGAQPNPGGIPGGVPQLLGGQPPGFGGLLGLPGAEGIPPNIFPNNNPFLI